MSLSPKWLLGLFALWAIINAIVLTTEGNFLGSDQVGVLERVTQMGWGSPGAFFELILTCIFWDSTFFLSVI